MGGRAVCFRSGGVGLARKTASVFEVLQKTSGIIQICSLTFIEHYPSLPLKQTFVTWNILKNVYSVCILIDIFNILKN